MVKNRSLRVVLLAGVGVCALAADLSLAQSAPGRVSRVTEVRLEVVPPQYSGPCPADVRLVGTIVSDGPGTAYFQFQAGAVGGNKDGSLDFSEAGSQTVTSEGHIRSTPQVQRVRFLAGMEPRGHQENAKWIDAPLDIRCGGAAPRAAVGRPVASTAAPSRLIGLPEGTQVEAEYNGAALKLKPQEQVAFLFVQSIAHLEKEECPNQLGRPCTLEEIVAGVPGKDGQVIGLVANPTQDSSYRYTVAVSGKRYEVAAVPRQPGLTGFLYVGPDGFGIGDFYFNPAGPAGTGNQSLSGFGHSGNDFRRRQ